MMYSEIDELSEQERAAIAALPRALAPSDLLEERVVRALKHQGHFDAVGKQRRPRSTSLMRAAAAIALFAGGVATGHYVLLSPQENAKAASEHASVTKPPPHTSTGAQTVKNNETVVAEREMWL